MLLGATDLSRSIAERIIVGGMNLAGILHVGRRVEISYNKSGFTNQRFADMEDFASEHQIANEPWTTGEALARFVRETEADVILAAGWYHMVPKIARDAAPKGALGLHASLLPLLRGGAPLNWALLSGFDETGVSLFVLGDGVDDGAIVAQSRFAIGARDEVTVLVQRAEEACLLLIGQCLSDFVSGRLLPVEQDHSAASYCLQRIPDDSRIRWNEAASSIDRLVRASARPYSGAFADLDGVRVTIWKARPVSKPRVLGAAGQIIRFPDERIGVVTGEGVLEIIEAEADGADAMHMLSRANNRRFKFCAG